MNVRLAVREIKRHLTFSFIIIVLLSAIFFMFCIMTSVVSYRFTKYNVFKNQLTAKGEAIRVQMGMLPENSKFIKKKSELSEVLHHVDSIQGMYQLSELTYHQYYKIMGWAYDDEMIRAYQPEMIEGEWLSPDFEEEGILKAVVTADARDVSVGDTLVITEPMYHLEMEVEIVGIAATDSEFIGCDAGNAASGTINDYFADTKGLQNTGMYSPGINLDVQHPVLFFVNDQLSRHPYFDSVAGANGQGIQRVMSGVLFITFADSITEDEIRENEAVLSNFSLYAMNSTEEIREKTLEFIFEQLYTLFPVAVGIALLVFTGIFSVEILSTKEQLHNYSIYYITGMRWKDCIKINLWHEIIIHIASFVIFIGLYYISYVFHFIDKNLIKIHGSYMVMIVLLSIVNCLFSLIVPKLMIHKTEAVQMLKVN